MGHRALVAYERPRGLYNLHYSHWGAQGLQLNHSITSMTPFGGPEPSEWSQSTYEALITGDRAQYEARLEEEYRPETAVRPEPMATTISFDHILRERLDYLRYEAFYLVSTNVEVTSYLTLWFGLEGYCKQAICSLAVGNGALVGVQWDESVGDGYVSESFEAMKSIVGDMVDRGVFTLDEASEYLQTKLASHVDERADLLVRTPNEMEPPL